MASARIYREPVRTRRELRVGEPAAPRRSGRWALTSSLRGSSDAPAQPWVWALLIVAVAGAGELAQFDVSSWGSLSVHPGRLGGAVLGLLLWVVLLGGAARRLVSPRLPGRALRWVAVVVALGSIALVPVHLAADAGGWRPAGAALAVLALLATLKMGPGGEPAQDQP